MNETLENPTAELADTLSAKEIMADLTSFYRSDDLALPEGLTLRHSSSDYEESLTICRKLANGKSLEIDHWTGGLIEYSLCWVEMIPRHPVRALVAKLVGKSPLRAKKCCHRLRRDIPGPHLDAINDMISQLRVAHEQGKESYAAKQAENFAAESTKVATKMQELFN